MKFLKEQFVSFDNQTYMNIKQHELALEAGMSATH